MASATLRVFPRLADSPGIGRVPVFRIKKCALGFRPVTVRSSAATPEDRVFENVAVRAEKPKNDVVDESSSWPSPSDVSSPLVDNKFNGWFTEADLEDEKNSMKIAAMQVATGFLLALGLSLSYFFWCRKQGRKLIPTPPTLTQFQLPSFSKVISSDKTKRFKPEEVTNEESEETRKSFGKQSLQAEVLETEESEDNANKGEVALEAANEGKVAKREDVEVKQTEDAVEGKQQILSDDNVGETQPTVVPVTHDQETVTASDNGKSQFSEDLQKQPAGQSVPEAEKPRQDSKRTSGKPQISEDMQKQRAAQSVPEIEKPTKVQNVDDKSQVSEGLQKQPAAQAVPEFEKSRQDSKTTQTDSNDAAQRSDFRPRKPRKSQRSKRKTSGRRGNVVVPAVVDRVQEQALAVLQAMKVIEEGFNSGAICKRRDYARWIMSSSSMLTRNSASKVFPAMYIEGVTELAFDDVSPNDPDFAYIQGLAEAGLIPSRFSSTSGELDEWGYDSDPEETNFSPDSPLSRLDLVTWKVALGGHSLSSIDKEALQEKSGFLDIDQVESTSWPTLSVDLESGDNSIIRSAFGLTRRFQPDKAATIGQAAIALASGESAEIFSEELARFEAQRMADEAVAADEAAEEQKQKELNALFDGQLTTERQLKEQAQKMFEELKAELDKMKEERDSEMDVLWKDKAAVEAERELLQHIRQQVAEQLQALSTRVMQVSIEQEKLEKLRFNFEDEEAELSRLKSEAQIEKQAFLQARLWAEDEARRAQNLAEALENTRTRMANQPTSNKGTIFANKPWMKARTGLEEFLQRASSLPRDLMHKGEDLTANISNALIQSWKTILRLLGSFLQIVGDFFREVRLRTLHFYHVTSSSTGNLLQDSAFFVSQKLQDLLTMLSQFITSMANGIKRFASECDGGVRKLSSQLFKG